MLIRGFEHRFLVLIITNKFTCFNIKELFFWITYKGILLFFPQIQLTWGGNNQCIDSMVMISITSLLNSPMASQLRCKLATNHGNFCINLVSSKVFLKGIEDNSWSVSCIYKISFNKFLSNIKLWNIFFCKEVFFFLVWKCFWLTYKSF